MKKSLLIAAALPLIAAAPLARAATHTYNITATWYEPDTQPKNSIFTGTFDYDDVTKQVTNLTGGLSESMTGVFPMPADGPNAPYYDQTILNLTYQMNDWVASYSGATHAPPSTNWHDDTLGGTFATVFLKNATATYMGGVWTPQEGAEVGGVFTGGPKMSNYAASIQNAYALIFVPDSLGTANTAGNPVTLTWNEAAGTGSLGLAYTSYADCAPGGMMGATCMSAWSVTAYGTVGTMSGHPLSQTIHAAPVPEASSYALMVAGLGMIVARMRRRGGPG